MSELFELLQEMDRRYFLIQDLKWEFSLLDTTMSDTITEDKAQFVSSLKLHRSFWHDINYQI